MERVQLARDVNTVTSWVVWPATLQLPMEQFSQSFFPVNMDRIPTIPAPSAIGSPPCMTAAAWIAQITASTASTQSKPTPQSAYLAIQPTDWSTPPACPANLAASNVTRTNFNAKSAYLLPSSCPPINASPATRSLLNAQPALNLAVLHASVDTI